MKNNIILKEFFKVPASTLYEAWLNSEAHTKMTGGEAMCSDVVGGKFTAWDGYIEGENLELIPNQKIVQSWRTSEFLDKDPDSLLTIQFIVKNEGTELNLIHENIPEGQSQYEEGWKEHYFTPMHIFFDKI